MGQRRVMEVSYGEAIVVPPNAKLTEITTYMWPGFLGEWCAADQHFDVWELTGERVWVPRPEVWAPPVQVLAQETVRVARWQQGQDQLQAWLPPPQQQQPPQQPTPGQVPAQQRRRPRDPVSYPPPPPPRAQPCRPPSQPPVHEQSARSGPHPRASQPPGQQPLPERAVWRRLRPQQPGSTVPAAVRTVSKEPARSVWSF